MTETWRNRKLAHGNGGVFRALLGNSSLNLGVAALLHDLGKLAVFTAVVDGGLYWLAILGGVAAVVAAAYYLRLIASIWFGATVESALKAHRQAG